MKLKGGLVGIVIFLMFLVVLTPAFSAVSITISPANPDDSNDLTCLMNGKTSGFNAKWKGSGVTQQGIIVNPLPASKTQIGTAKCEAWVPNPLGNPILAGSASATVTSVDTCAGNHAPTLNISNQSVDQTSTLILNLRDYSSDQDGNALNYTVRNENISQADCSISGRTLTITPVSSFSGMASCRIRATDTCNAFADSTFNISVNFVDTTNPIVSLIDHITLDEDTTATLALDDYVSDNNPDSTLTWTVTGNTNIQITIDPVTHVATFVPAGNWSGQEDVTFTAYDPSGNYGQDNVRVIVNPVNDAPWIDPVIPDQTAQEDSAPWSLDLKNYQHDVESSTLIWTVSGVDASLLIITIDANSNAIFTLVPNRDGNDTVTFTLSDGLASVSQDVLVTVTPINHAPVIIAFSPVLNVVMNEGSSQLFAITASDLDNDTLVYDWLLDGVSVSNTNEFNYSALNGPETHTLLVNVSDGLLSASVTWTINILNLPPTISAAADIVNESQTTTVTANASDPGINDALTYSFDFNNDGSFEVQDSVSNIATYTWMDDGIYPIRIIVDDNDGGTASIIINAEVLDLGPTAVINALLTVTNEGSPLIFDGNLSTSYPDTIALYEWDWNYDGTFAAEDTGSDASHIWMDNGTYVVGLRVIDEDGSMNIAAISIDVLDLGPVADFIFSSNNSFAEPSTVSFIDTSFSYPDLIVSWSWDFDNNGVEDLNIQFPTHDFIQNGTYPVTLMVIDEDGSNSTITRDVVIYDTHPVITDLSGPLSIVEGNEATFNSAAASYDGIVNYQWNFADGNITDSGLSSINHLFVQNGTYEVILTIYEADGDYNTSSWNITVQDTVPVAIARSDFVFVNEGIPLQFYGNSSTAYDGILSYSWNFSDGTPLDTLDNPAHTFVQDGIYDVYLTVTDNDGSVNTTRLTVGVIDINPIANFSFLPINPLETELVDFADSSYSYDGIINWSWNFGDGNITQGVQNPAHNYNSGNYNITLTVFEADGDTSSVTYPIRVNDTEPVANFIYAPNPANEWDNVTFTSTSTYPHDQIVSWLWNFGDGSTASGEIVNHIYASNGTYNVTLTITDSDGSVDSIAQTLDVQNVPVQVTLTANPLNGNEPLNVSFTCTATGNAPFTYSFNFLTGSITTNSSSFIINTTYNNGTYNATCSVIDADGDTNVSSQLINVDDLAPQTAFYYSPLNPIENESINFTDNSTYVVDPITDWSWNFGDGNASALRNPTHSYLQNGNYAVTLTTTDVDGSVNSTSQIVAVGDTVPTVLIVAPSTAVENTTVTFTGFGAGYDIPLNYSWDFDANNGITEEATGQIATNRYLQNGTYIVTLTITDNDGDTASATHTINITDTTPIAVAQANPYPSVAEGVSVQFDASNSTGYDQPLTYLWNFGDSSTSTLVSPTHVYTDQGNYAVILTVRDNDGSTNTAILNLAVADAVPVADFTFVPVNPNEGSLVQFNDLSTPGYDGIVSWFWDFGDGSNSTLQNPAHTYVDNGVYTIILTVNDSDGSVASDTTPIQVNNVNPIANANGPYACGLGSSVSLNGSVSDPGNDTLTFAWDLDNNGVYETSGQNVTYSCLVEGVHDIALQVTDDDLGADTDNTNVTVYNIVINEFESNNGINNSEWIEVFNPSTSIINLNNWYIQDRSGNGFNLTGILNPNNYTIISMSNRLDNGGEDLALYAYGIIIDNVNYNLADDGSIPNNCWARVPNGVDTNTMADWIFQLCTRGATNNLVVNTAPTLAILPDQNYLQDSGSHDNVIDIWAYASDAQDADSVMTYSIISETNTAVVDCLIDLNRYINCSVQAGMIGFSDVTVRVTDTGLLTADDTFRVNVNPLGLPQCSDGVDNDGDLLTDANDAGCYNGVGIYDPSDNDELNNGAFQCNDGLDNDGDTFVDWNYDAQCSSPIDNSEAPITAQCSDGIDNDGDGDIDYPNDPGCVDTSDNDETDPVPMPLCSDGLDNDGDLLIDYLSDPGCTSASDNDETNVVITQCNDGIDNDGDLLTDANDAGCYTSGVYDPNDVSEVNTLPQCSDFFDNDADTFTDYPTDIGCLNAVDNDESNPLQTIINSFIYGTYYPLNFEWQVVEVPVISSTIKDSSIMGITANFITNSNITGSSLTLVAGAGETPNVNNCVLIDSTYTYYDCVDVYIDPSDIFMSNVGGSTITDSHIWYSISTNSDISNSTIDNSTVTGSTINNATINYAVINSNIISSGTITINGRYYNATERGSMNINRIANNIVPVANAGSDQSVSTGATVTLNAGSSSDANSDSLTYRWVQNLGINVTINNQNTAVATFNTSLDGIYTFKLVVDDGITNNSDSVTITASTPCTNCGGGGGGGGGSPGELICSVELFNCTEWSNCNPDGTMTRACVPNRKCIWGTKPQTNGTCTYYPKETTPVVVNETEEPAETPVGAVTYNLGPIILTKDQLLYGGIGLGIILLMLIGLIVYKLTRPKIIEHTSPVNPVAKDFVKKRKR